MGNSIHRSCLIISVLLGTVATVIAQNRDPWLWPFQATSIWNMPIGSDAIYVDIDLVPTRGVGIDVKHFQELDNSFPLRDVVGFDRFAPNEGRCAGDTYMNGLQVNIPNSFTVVDVFSGSPYGNKPNASFVFLNTDKQTTWNGPSIARCSGTGPLYMRSSQRFANNRSTDNLFSDGVSNTGGQGASSMSGLGGTIRIGELVGNAPIRHAIKINPWAAHLYYSSEIPGYKWPATSADQYANDPTHKNQYIGNNPDLVMGSLIAIPPDITAEDLNLTTEPARKILFTLQNYGAYITEDAGWDVFDFIIQEGVEQEFEDFYGFSMKGDLWESEILKIASALKVIANNTPNSIGGGGTPLQPLACALGTVGSGQTCPENDILSTTLFPSDDGSLNAGFNQSEIKVEFNNTNRIGYFKFDLSSVVGNISDIKFRLYCTGDAGNGILSVYRGLHNDWNESETTNLPETGEQLASLNQSFAVGNWYEWDLNTTNLSQGSVTTLILQQDAGGNDVWFGSQESNFTPELIISFQPTLNCPLHYLNDNRLSLIVNESQIYQTSGSIESNQILISDGDLIRVTYLAGQDNSDYITLLPSFEINLNVSFEARLEGCMD